MRLCVLLLVLMAAHPLPGQSLADSLKRELLRIERVRPGFARDTSRVSLLCQLAKQTKEWQAARVYWEHAMNVAEKADWAAGRLKAYEGMGRLYRSRGANLEATYYFHQGLLLAEQTGNRRYQVDCHRYLGIAYSQAGDTLRSLAALRKAAGLARLLDDSRPLLLTLNDIGNVYSRAHNYPEALRYYQRCTRQNPPPDSTYHCWFLTNIAVTFLEINKLNASQKAFEELFRFGKHLPSEDSVEAFSLWGKLHLKQGQPEVALRYCQVAERIAPRIQNPHMLSRMHQTLSEIYAVQSNWKLALLHEQQYRIYHDSLLSQEQRQRLDGAKLGYENEQQRREVRLLQERQLAQDQSNRLLWAGVALLTALGGTLFAANHLLRRKRQKIEHQNNEIAGLNASLEHRVAERTAELRHANEELLHKNREIEAALLKGQTLERQRVASELHDNLGGTLTAIRWRLESLRVDDLNEVERAIYADLHGMISRAYGEVRLLSHHLMPEILEKEGLETALHELASPVNKTKRLALKVETTEVSPLLDSRQQLELYSIVLELITNILKHAQATEAQLQLGMDEQGVLVRVSDNGIGIPGGQPAAGVGMKNIQTRLNVIGGRWEVTSAPGEGTTVLIRLPLSVLLSIPASDRA